MWFASHVGCDNSSSTQTRCVLLCCSYDRTVHLRLAFLLEKVPCSEELVGETSGTDAGVHLKSVCVARFGDVLKIVKNTVIFPKLDRNADCLRIVARRKILYLSTRSIGIAEYFAITCHFAPTLAQHRGRDHRQNCSVLKMHMHIPCTY